ncbi:hypothetical protein BOX15_Mlig012654g2 [Macrostomum lignano]|uniref:MORN repeat-containing protein 5 n=1 Tax=Macrostomum lignano TaxID=282301 RepID=A0A267FZE9_9PLAT|nr:hypothetical protein BOX15_Mlig012654g2 [Macrostomum lignano]
MPPKKGKSKEPAEPVAPPTGTFFFSNGDKYEGEYLIGEGGALQRQGKGRHTSSDGLQYEGDFDKDAMSGTGRLFFPSGAAYEGQFHENQMHGRGCYRFPDGSCYEGDFFENRLEGNGKFTDTNGQEWVGSFLFRSAPGLRFNLRMEA